MQVYHIIGCLFKNIKSKLSFEKSLMFLFKFMFILKKMGVSIKQCQNSGYLIFNDFKLPKHLFSSSMFRESVKI